MDSVDAAVAGAAPAVELSRKGESNVEAAAVRVQRAQAVTANLFAMKAEAEAAECFC